MALFSREKVLSLVLLLLIWKNIYLKIVLNFVLKQPLDYNGFYDI